MTFSVLHNFLSRITLPFTKYTLPLCKDFFVIVQPLQDKPTRHVIRVTFANMDFKGIMVMVCAS